jgi:CheY-like chemotaxis protein
VRVSDNGIGISAEQLPRLFEMFSQGDSLAERARGGMGIGLSLARGLVEMHGGTIGALSGGVGQGSEFVVRLPRAGEAGAAVPAQATAQPAAAPPCRVLVADDLRDSADSLGLLIELMGHAVEVAYDGEEALRRAERFRPDIALLDLGMPKLDGFAVCERIRAAPWGATMRLVAQSGWGQDDDRRRTAAAGFDHHLVKPIDPLALDALVQELAAAVAQAPSRACRPDWGLGARRRGGRRPAHRAQPADDAVREVVDREHEQDPEPEQPAVGRDDLRQDRHVLHARGAELHQVLQVVLRQHEQHAADDRAVDRAHAADDDDQQHVEHDLERSVVSGPL